MNFKVTQAKKDITLSSVNFTSFAEDTIYYYFAPFSIWMRIHKINKQITVVDDTFSVSVTRLPAGTEFKFTSE